MEMNSISEELVSIVNDIMPETLVYDSLKALDIIARFNTGDVEATYINIAYSGSIDPDTKDLVMGSEIRKGLCNILEAHKVHLNPEGENRITTLTMICNALIKLQDQENYDVILKITNSDATNREKFLEVLKTLTEFDYIEVLEMIKDVDDIFFKLLDDVAMSNTDFSMDIEGVEGDRKLARAFIAYTSEADTLGSQLWAKGYDRLMLLEELLNILPYDVKDGVTRELGRGKQAHVAIDVLSLLMICRDSQVNPVEFLGENGNLFYEDLNALSQQVSIIREMYNGFLVYLKSFEEQRDGNTDQE